jgi:hypothetical protein
VVRAATVYMRRRDKNIVTDLHYAGHPLPRQRWRNRRGIVSGNIYTTIEGLCFLGGPCRGVTLKTTGAASVARYSSNSNDVSTEAGETSLLRIVTRKRQWKARRGIAIVESCYQAIWLFLCIASTINGNLTVSNRKIFSRMYYGSHKLSYLTENWN